jgi:hypothetical protein
LIDESKLPKIPAVLYRNLYNNEDQKETIRDYISTVQLSLPASSNTLGRTTMANVLDMNFNDKSREESSIFSEIFRLEYALHREGSPDSVPTDEGIILPIMLRVYFLQVEF